MDTLKQLETSEYLMVQYNSISEVASLSLEILEPKEAKKLSDEIGSIIMSIAFYDDYDITEFLIRKDSLLGKFILNPNRKRYIKCIDAFISYDDAFNAFLFASISHNVNMANSIKELINSNASGFIAELKERFDYNTLLYIYNSKSLEDFMFSSVKDSTKRYFVYEENHISVIRSSQVYTLHA